MQCLLQLNRRGFREALLFLLPAIVWVLIICYIGFNSDTSTHYTLLEQIKREEFK